MKTPDFTLGIEEEFLLVDPVTRDLVADPPEELFQRCGKALGTQVSHEFLRAQIEVGTPVCTTIQEARQHLSELRQTLVHTVANFDLAIIAASTHPTAYWDQQQHTPQERYDTLAEELQEVVRRLVTCGMHVHIGINDEDLRVELMNQVTYFLPHLLALSTSSPFWGGRDTGLKSYRLSVFNELPRTGLPDTFKSYADYQQQVDILVKVGSIGDASKLWWDLRPSARFPTIEMRITDVCTHVDDAICIAALYLATTKMLVNLRQRNQHWRQYAPMLIRENRWRAQRYGIDEGLIDFSGNKTVNFAELAVEWVELVKEAANELDCEKEINHIFTILEQGTSADQQRRVYHHALAKTGNVEQALRHLVDWLIKRTAGC